MQLLSTISLLSAIVQRCIATSPPPPLPLNIIDMAGGAPVTFPQAYAGSEVAIQQIQLLEYMRNIQVAIFQFGIDNIPTFGFSGYPRGLIDVLEVWKAVSISNAIQSPTNSRQQSQVDIQDIETVLIDNDKPTMPPCKYTFPMDNLELTINSTDIFLAIAGDITQAALGESLGSAGIFASNNLSALAIGAGAAASVDGRRDAYIKTITGVNSTPSDADTAIPPAFAYGQLQYYIVPGEAHIHVSFLLYTSLPIHLPLFFVCIS